MTAYVEKASGVRVDIPEELAEKIGGFEPVKESAGPEAEVPEAEGKQSARRPRRTADDD